MSDFEIGYWARVIARDASYHHRQGQVIDVEYGRDDNVWITLSIDGEEIMFERRELIPCPAPKTGPIGER